jgi:hypothetical protein
MKKASHMTNVRQINLIVESKVGVVLANTVL